MFKLLKGNTEVSKELGDKKLKREQLFAGAEFQIVTTAIQYCPDSIPKDITKKLITY